MYNKVFFSVLFCLVLLVQSVLLSAQTTALTPAQQKYLLEKAAEIEDVARQHMKQSHASVIQTLQRAAGNPDQALKIYLDAVENLDFTEQGKKESQFREWRDKRQGQFRDSEFSKALQLQAQYILLTLEVMEGRSDEDLSRLIPRVLVYVGRVTEIQPLNRRSVLWRSLNSTYYVRNLNINLSGTLYPGWVMTPGDTQKIYDSFIVPSILKLKNVEMLRDAWDIRLIQEAALAQKANEIEEFNSLKLAKLHWKRAKNFHTIGDLDNGLLRMLTLLQNNTQHPQALDWSLEFQDLIHNASPKN